LSPSTSSQLLNTLLDDWENLINERFQSGMHLSRLHQPLHTLHDKVGSLLFPTSPAWATHLTLFW
jgi:hypothetical protein